MPAMGIDGRGAGNPQQPGRDAAVTAAESAQAGERALERLGGEVKGVRVAARAGAEVSVDGEAMGLVEQPEVGWLKPLCLGLGGWAQFVLHERCPHHGVPLARQA